jgi:hypothetical protein
VIGPAAQPPTARLWLRVAAGYFLETVDGVYSKPLTDPCRTVRPPNLTGGRLIATPTP